jgi:hypothetical protein
MDGFVDRLHALRFLRACDPSYRALTFALMGLPPTEHISLSLDIPCHRHYPGRFDEACSLVPLHRLRPSLCNSQVGSCNCFFGACSAFTHVMACTLAEPPCDPFHRKLRQLRCLRCRFDCYGWSEPVPGRELHPLKSSAFHGALFRQLSSKLTLSRACGIYFIDGQKGVGLGAEAGKGWRRNSDESNAEGSCSC